MQESILELEDVAIGYGSRLVLGGINFSLQRGSFTGLLGSNGAGKSTLIKTILRIIPPLGGRVTFGETGGRPQVLGYVPQREALDSIFLLSSFEVVLMGACGRVRPGRFFGRVERDWAHHCLRETGTDDLSRRPFAQLSVGSGSGC